MSRDEVGPRATYYMQRKAFGTKLGSDQAEDCKRSGRLAPPIPGCVRRIGTSVGSIISAPWRRMSAQGRPSDLHRHGPAAGHGHAGHAHHSAAPGDRGRRTDDENDRRKTDKSMVRSRGLDFRSPAGVIRGLVCWLVGRVVGARDHARARGGGAGLQVSEGGQLAGYSSWRRHQMPSSLRPLGARSSHWYMPQRLSSPRA